MLKYAAIISYIGTDFCGWQSQLPGEKSSIQQTIECALQKITGEGVKIIGSGRTDSGVHAVGQVMHFVLTKKPWEEVVLQRGLNSLLPRSIQVRLVCQVPLDFHAQRSAQKKQYSYYFQQGPCTLPHLDSISWWIQKRLDRDAMNQAVQMLVGTQDYKPFQGSGSKPGSTVRTILEAEITSVPIGFPLGLLMDSSFEFVRVRIVGTGFLKQMVRGIAGTLLQVGEGRRSSSCMGEILETQQRNLVGPTAPAKALWLEKVWYPEASGLHRELTN